jgi:hypothetical protein
MKDSQVVVIGTVVSSRQVPQTWDLLFLTNNYQHWVANKCGNSGPLDEKDAVIKQMVRAARN